MSIVLLFMVAQVQVSQSDLPLIVEAVLEDVIKEDFYPGRSVHFDLQQTVAAFRSGLIRQASLELSEVGDLPDRSVLAGARDEVVSCPDGLSCSITDDGIFVSIHSARRAPTPGEILLRVECVWVHDPSRRYRRLWGYVGEFFMSRAEQGGWEVARKGVHMVF